VAGNYAKQRMGSSGKLHLPRDFAVAGRCRHSLRCNAGAPNAGERKKTPVAMYDRRLSNSIPTW
jgi:hypothetical protein